MGIHQMHSVRRIKDRSSVILLMLPLFGCAPSVAPNSWKTFRYSDLGFAIDFPLDPKVQKEVVQVGMATCSSTTLTDVQGRVDTLLISVTDCGDTPIPEAALNNATALRRLAGSIAGTVGGMLNTNTEYVLEGVRGREYTGEQPVKGFRLKCFTFVSGKRIYLLAAIGNSPDLEREIKSFTFRVT